MKHIFSALTFALALNLPVHAFEEPSPPPEPSAEKRSDPRGKTIEEWRALKFGLFIHFGLYSIPGGVWEGKEIHKGYSEQIQSHAKIPRKDYIALTEQFNPEKWDPDAIAKLAKGTGMRYVVLTAKHHDGFNLFDTEYSDYNVVAATPYKRDIVKGLAEACARHGLKFGIYFSTIDWNFPFAPPISSHNSDPVSPEMEGFIAGQLEELMTGYGPICEVWFDMGAPTPAQSKLFADTVRKLQPTTLVNGRIWNDEGDFLVMGDNQIPNEDFSLPWETPASMYHATWGYRSWQVRNDLEGKVREKIQSLIKVAARGGNYLLNIGPRGDGSVVEFEADVLRGVGAWVARNGDAVFNAVPAENAGHPSWGEIMRRGDRFFLHVLRPPQDGVLNVERFEGRVTAAYRLDDPDRKPLSYLSTNDVFRLNLPEDGVDPNATVYVVETEGAATFLPEQIYTPDGKGEIVLDRDKLMPQLGVSGRDYYSQRLTAVALQAYIRAEAGVFQIEVAGASQTPDRPYRLQIGEMELVGTLPIRRDSVELSSELCLVRLERADAAHIAEDIGLGEVQIHWKPVVETP